MSGRITDSQTITFWNTEIGAIDMAHRNGGEAEGFRAAPAKGRPGKFVVEVFDIDDGLLLGYL